MLNNPSNEKIILKIQSKPPLAQFEAISLCFDTFLLGEETDPNLVPPSSQGILENDKIPPQISFSPG